MRYVILPMLVILSLVSFSRAQETGVYGDSPSVFFHAAAIEDLDEREIPKQYGAGFEYSLNRRFAVEALYTLGSSTVRRPLPPDSETGSPGFTERYDEKLQMFLGRTLFFFTRGRGQAYLVGGIGMMHTESEGNFRTYPVPDGPPIVQSFRESETKVAGEAGGGLRYYFHRRIYLSAEASLLMTSPNWMFKGALSAGYSF